MYYPYFRGKQYELITIRELADLMHDNGFVPIIEPVKEQLSGLKKTLDVLCKKQTRTILIVNPQYGDHSFSGDQIAALMVKSCEENGNLVAGVLITEGMLPQTIVELIEAQGGREIALIHAGFSEGKLLAEKISGYNNITTSVFIDELSGRLYQKHFNSPIKVLIKDGFEQRTNREHPDAPEFFSDLHLTYSDYAGVTGFGDFLIVGSGYRESGGPAYTIAIHLTFIDGDKDDAMYIQHFKSIRQDTPKDPAGKFAEALKKLTDVLKSPDNKFYQTSAILEFKELARTEHYPGLGHIKKLSMKHHIETLAIFRATAGT